MKKIITTVGTSLITNAIENERIENRVFIELQSKSYSEINKTSLKSFIDELKNNLNELVKINDSNLSAEIASIIKITEQEPNEQFEVYLIATDTILSPICAKYIQEWFKDGNNRIIKKIAFNNNNKHIIKDLSISDSESFKKNGANNLFNILDNILEHESYSPFFVLNITGGYKALIPYLTIFGQINNVKIVYKFEDTNKLIEIPQLPINIDYSLFVQYYDTFKQLKDTIEEKWNHYKIKKNLPDIFDNYVESISEGNNNLTSLNFVGAYFFKKVENYYIIDVNSASKFFTENSGNKRQLVDSIRELYSRIYEVIKNNKVNNNDILHNYINNLGDKNDLRHGANPMVKTYIFKSTDQNQIRIVYSFEYKNNFLKIRLYDFVLGNFNHASYIDEFKKKFSVKNEFEYITISIKKN